MFASLTVPILNFAPLPAGDVIDWINQTTNRGHVVIIGIAVLFAAIIILGALLSSKISAVLIAIAIGAIAIAGAVNVERIAAMFGTELVLSAPTIPPTLLT